MIVSNQCWQVLTWRQQDVGLLWFCLFRLIAFFIKALTDADDDNLAGNATYHTHTRARTQYP